MARKTLGRARGDQQAAMIRLLAKEAAAQDQLGDNEKVLAFLDQALTLSAATYGTNDVSTAKALQNKAYAEYKGENIKAAAETIANAQTVFGKVLEKDHPYRASSSLLAGRIYSEAGQIAMARSSFSEARRIQIALNGADNPWVGDVDFYAAEAEIAAGFPRKALAYADNAKRIYDIAYGPDDPDQAEVGFLRARIYAALGAASDAKGQCATAVGLTRKLEIENPDGVKLCKSLTTR